jgi:DUF2917 family protein
MLIDLNEQETWSAPVGKDGVDIRVASGSVWVTQATDPEDHVLAAPGALESRREGKVVVFALTPARFEVVRPWPAARHAIAALHPLRVG